MKFIHLVPGWEETETLAEKSHIRRYQITLFFDYFLKSQSLQHTLYRSKSLRMHEHSHSEIRAHNSCNNTILQRTVVALPPIFTSGDRLYDLYCNIKLGVQGLLCGKILMWYVVYSSSQLIVIGSQTHSDQGHIGSALTLP